MVRHKRSWPLPFPEAVCPSVSPCRAETCFSASPFSLCHALFQPLSLTGGFALLVALRPNFFHCNFSQKPVNDRDSKHGRKGEALSSLSRLRLPVSKGIFVVLTAYAGSLTNDRHVDGWILKLFLPDTHRSSNYRQTDPRKSAKKSSHFRKSFHVQRRVVVR